MRGDALPASKRSLPPPLPPECVCVCVFAECGSERVSVGEKARQTAPHLACLRQDSLLTNAYGFWAVRPGLGVAVGRGEGEATVEYRREAEPLEPRIMLSGTWVDVDTNDPLDGPTTGNDSFTGTALDDFADGGAGNDILDGDVGDDALLGGDGNDTLTGGTGRDFLAGGAGNDVIDGGGEEDVIVAGQGDDIVNAGDKKDVIHYTGGNDTLNGGAGNDTLNGNDGNDGLSGFTGTCED